MVTVTLAWKLRCLQDSSMHLRLARGFAVIGLSDFTASDVFPAALREAHAETNSAPFTSLAEELSEHWLD